MTRSFRPDHSHSDVVPAQGTGRFTLLFPVCLVALAALLISVNTLGNGLVVDDLRQIEQNPLIRDIRHVPEILTTGVWDFEGRQSSYYRPLMHLLYMAVYVVIGPQAWGFHLLNVLFHAGVCILVFLILRRLLPVDGPSAARLYRSAPLLGALLFAAHPIHTEAVAWAAGIVDITFTFFFLLSFYFYISRKELPPRAGLALSLAAFLLATLCKEPAVTLPVAIVAYDLLFGGRDGRSRSAAGRWLLFVGVAGVYVALRMNALHGFAPITAETDLGWSRYLSSVVTLFSLYLEKLLLPLNLNFFHHFRPPDSIVSMAGAGALAGAIGFVAVACLAWKRSRTAFFALMLIVVPLLPAFHLAALNQGLENAFTERYLYLPSFGFILLLAVIVDRAMDRRPHLATALIVAMVVVFALYSAGTVRRNLVWRDALTLWGDAVKKSPDSAVAHASYGYALMYGGRNDEGRDQLRIAMSLNPDLPNASINRGLAYARKGLLKKSLLAFNTALTLDPDSVQANYLLAVAYDDKGWYDQAIAHYRKTLELQPDLARAHNNLGVLYAKGGRMREALPHFEAATRLQPDDASFRANLQRAHQQGGAPEEPGTAEDPAHPNLEP